MAGHYLLEVKVASLRDLNTMRLYLFLIYLINDLILKDDVKFVLFVCIIRIRNGLQLVGLIDREHTVNRLVLTLFPPLWFRYDRRLLIAFDLNNTVLMMP